MRVDQAVDEWIFGIQHLSPATVYHYKRYISTFVDWCAAQTPPLQLEDIKQYHIRKYTDFIRKTPNKRNGEPLSSYTVQDYIRALSTFLHWCHMEDGLEEFVSSKTVDRIQLPKLDKVIKPVFAPGDIQRLLDAAAKEGYYTGDSWKPYPELAARSQAVIAVLADTGIRASELVGLTLEHTHCSPGDSWIKVMGKGRKERVVALGKEASKYLNRYLKRYRLLTGYRHPDPGEQHTFLTRDRKPMTVSGLDQMLYRLAERAGFPDGSVACHRFRHNFAYQYIAAGGDIFALSIVMGHTSTDITQLYLHEYKSEEARLRGISVLDNQRIR